MTKVFLNLLKFTYNPRKFQARKNKVKHGNNHCNQIEVKHKEYKGM